MLFISKKNQRNPMRPTRQHFTHALTADLSVVALLISAVNIVAGVIFTLPALATISAVVQFAAFDVVVFKHIHHGNEQDMQGRAYYRIVQGVYQYGLLLLLLHLFGYWCVLYMVLWWIGVCDYMYYVFLGVDTPLDVNDMYWVDWTLQGILCSLLFGRNLTGKEFHRWTWILFLMAIGVIVLIKINGGY